MLAIMNTPIVQKQFTIESDIPYLDLRSRACTNLDLDPSNAELGYHVTGRDGPRLYLHYLTARMIIQRMGCICKLISHS